MRNCCLLFMQFHSKNKFFCLIQPIFGFKFKQIDDGGLPFCEDCVTVCDFRGVICGAIFPEIFYYN